MADAGMRPSGFLPRRDIQGLRAIAVGAVVTYHLFPQMLPGGFVGVDVFFVISGFLIVGSLVREVIRSGRISLLAFYARRIRRLLPAATAVLIATVVATVVLLPQSRWQGVSSDVVMSALQVQNWNQAFSSVSYEGATSLVSPVQHFWSLAVEEQFYIVMPLLLLGAAAIGRLLRLGRDRLCLQLLVLLTACSLAYSIVYSATDHNIAYFATTTRMWELGIGGMAALILPKMRLAPLVSTTCGWLGMGLIAISAVTFTTKMSFPGYVALVPVVGAALIMISPAASNHGTPRNWVALSSCLSARPLTYLGDISYSLYLWHWPLIVFCVFRLGRAPGPYSGALIVGCSIVLADLSYRFIEQRFRHGKPLAVKGGRRFRMTLPLRPAYLLGACLVVASTVAAGAPWVAVQSKFDRLDATADFRNYPGALSLQPQHPIVAPGGLPMKPDPAIATKDGPLPSKDDCGVYDPATIPDTACYYGDPAAKETAVIVGDSHASQYVDPLVSVGAAAGWKIHAMVRNGCPFSAAPPASSNTLYTNCSAQNQLTLEKILKSKPQSVIIAGMTPFGYGKALHWGWPKESDLVNGYVSMLQPLVAAGIKVDVILDVPYPPFSVPDCLQSDLGEQGTDKCNFVVPQAARPQDPLRQAAEQVPGVRAVDLWSYFCQGEVCPAVIGNVLVYRDNHMTNTFAKTLARPLQDELGW